MHRLEFPANPFVWMSTCRLRDGLLLYACCVRVRDLSLPLSVTLLLAVLEEACVKGRLAHPRPALARVLCDFVTCFMKAPIISRGFSTDGVRGVHSCALTKFRDSQLGQSRRGEWSYGLNMKQETPSAVRAASKQGWVGWVSLGTCCLQGIARH